MSETVSCGLSWLGSLGTQYQPSGVNSESQSSNLASSSSRASCSRNRSQCSWSSAVALRRVARGPRAAAGRCRRAALFALSLRGFAMMRRSGGGARVRRLPAGHEPEPGIEHVADIDLAGRILAAPAAMRVRHVALIAAADLQPLGALARHPHVETIVDLEVVGEHERAGAVDDVGEADRVAEHLLRRALEPEAVSVHDRAVDRDRMHDAQLLELAHQRDVRIDVGVPATHLQDALGLGLAFVLFERGNVFAEYRVLQRGDQLRVVVIIAEIAVAVGIGPDADL